MHFSLNIEFEQILEKDDIILLKNNRSDSLFKISKIEYLILQIFSSNQSLIETFNQVILINSGISFSYVEVLVEKAKVSKLLINDDDVLEIDKKKNESIRGNSPLILILLQLLNYLIKFLNKIKIDIKIEFTGSFRFYKLLSFDVSNSFISRLFIKKNHRYIIIGISIMIVLSVFYSLSMNGGSLSTNLIEETLFYGNTINKYIIFLVVVCGLISTSFAHELAHYFVYKLLGGVSNEFGFALMYFLIPVLYASTNSIYFWNEKWKKILVSSAGIISDILFIIFVFGIVNSTFSFHYSNIRFIGIILLFCLVFRTSFNLNFLIPGTDGYFIFSDVFNLKNFYSETKKSTLILLNSLIKMEIKELKIIRLIHIVYFILSWFFVIFLILTFLIIAIYPLISGIILKIFL